MLIVVLSEKWSEVVERYVQNFGKRVPEEFEESPNSADDDVVDSGNFETDLDDTGLGQLPFWVEYDLPMPLTSLDTSKGRHIYHQMLFTS